MSETIQDRVLRVIATTKRIPQENVRPDSTFEELGVDSLDRLNILFDLESEFDVEINDEDAKKVSSIHEMVEGITYLVNVKENPQPAAETAHLPTRSAAVAPALENPASENAANHEDDKA